MCPVPKVSSAKPEKETAAELVEDQAAAATFAAAAVVAVSGGDAVVAAAYAVQAAVIGQEEEAVTAALANETKSTPAEAAVVNHAQEIKATAAAALNCSSSVGATADSSTAAGVGSRPASAKGAVATHTATETLPAAAAAAKVALSPSALLARITEKILNFKDGSGSEPLSVFEETKVHHLVTIATDWTLLMDRRLAANCRNISDEVFPGIHLGDRGAAKNAFYLKKIGVTHVLNTAEGKRSGLVDTNENFYYPYGIKYKGLKLLDVAQTNIAVHFAEVAQYIDEALSSGGKVLVNCLMGMSRSSTCVLAYLMICQNMTAADALTAVRRHREVRPNDGFLKQLADLDNKLRRERGQLISVK